MKSDNLQPKFIQVLEITNLNIFYSVFFMLRTLMQWVPLLTFILKLFTWEKMVRKHNLDLMSCHIYCHVFSSSTD